MTKWPVLLLVAVLAGCGSDPVFLSGAAGSDATTLYVTNKDSSDWLKVSLTLNEDYNHDLTLIPAGQRSGSRSASSSLKTERASTRGRRKCCS